MAVTVKISGPGSFVYSCPTVTRAHPHAFGTGVHHKRHVAHVCCIHHTPHRSIQTPLTRLCPTIRIGQPPPPIPRCTIRGSTFPPTVTSDRAAPTHRKNTREPRGNPPYNSASTPHNLHIMIAHEKTRSRVIEDTRPGEGTRVV
jgi:hypothetical protein